MGPSLELKSNKEHGKQRCGRPADVPTHHTCKPSPESVPWHVVNATGSTSVCQDIVSGMDSILKLTFLHFSAQVSVLTLLS